MKLYMKQKVWSWRDRFYIKDEQENDRYYVEGEIFTLGKKLHMYDMNEREITYIEEKVWSFKPRFFVYQNGEQKAEIVKKITFFKPVYEIEGLDWEIEGDFWAHDYTITCRGREIISIHKVWWTWGDTYEIDIDDDIDETLAISVVLAIDAVLAKQNAAAGGGGTAGA